MSVVIAEQCNVTVNSDELSSTTEYLTLQTGYRINRCHYNRVRLYFEIHKVTFLAVINLCLAASRRSKVDKISDILSFLL
jgi:hypothetical protein